MLADPYIDALMAEGAPFEVVQQGSIRVYRHAPENMSEVFDQARRFGTTEFIVSGEQRLTFDDVFGLADGLSGWLQQDFGLKPGASVAICMQNCPEWIIAFIAIINAGGVAVLVNSRGTGETMARGIMDADCVLVIGDGKRLQRLEESGYQGQILSNRGLPAPAANFTPVARKSNDLAAMFFTSGTTGVAKAAAIQHRALITGMMNTQMAMAAVFQKMAAAYNIDVATLRSQMPQSCSLLVFPLFHTSGCSAVFLTALATGGKLVMMDRWDADAALALVEREKITTLGGVPGPRIPMETQKVEHLDEVCWFFPELKIVMRHGAEPWEDLAVKLMIKYPNLYYSTSAFAPKHYPKSIINYANTRGADKIIYAGYFPMGLSLDRIMSDMENVRFKDNVWPKFLRENAINVFNLGE